MPGTGYTVHPRCLGAGVSATPSRRAAERGKAPRRQVRPLYQTGGSRTGTDAPELDRHPGGAGGPPAHGGCGEPADGPRYARFSPMEPISGSFGLQDGMIGQGPEKRLSGRPEAIPAGFLRGFRSSLTCSVPTGVRGPRRSGAGCIGSGSVVKASSIFQRCFSRNPVSPRPQYHPGHGCLPVAPRSSRRSWPSQG